jgi:UDP:flavonoid glycosyltransferase YjiC (YdhE family)
MREATMMVGHGGAGSVLLALAAGVPDGAGADVRRSALQRPPVADLGAGLVVEDVLTQLQPAVRAVLDDPSYGTDRAHCRRDRSPAAHR